jgi:hypothetical protein
MFPTGGNVVTVKAQNYGPAAISQDVSHSGRAEVSATINAASSRFGCVRLKWFGEVRRPSREITELPSFVPLPFLFVSRRGHVRSRVLRGDVEPREWCYIRSLGFGQSYDA